MLVLGGLLLHRGKQLIADVSVQFVRAQRGDTRGDRGQGVGQTVTHW